MIEQYIGLHQKRLEAVVGLLELCNATRVLDLGCGEGRLIKLLLRKPQFKQIVGMDVSYRALEEAARRLKLSRMSDRQRQRISLLQGSLMYRDGRMDGFDAAAIVEVIEHLDPPSLAAFERVVFEGARPEAVIITTPNREYNVKWKTMPGGKFRHPDHRFEWTRTEFQHWSRRVAERYGYEVRFLPVGPEEPDIGAPSQIGVFTG
ncbi:MAG: methyltransferase [Gemmatimonadota bacterium]|nr:methyltransferase [Gemmatimonadota bacterium]